MNTNKHVFRVDSRDINYLRLTIESYDGMGVVRTLDPQVALIEVQVAPGCEQLFFDLIGSLSKDENIRLVEQSTPSGRVRL
jgi:23S rRNA G2069 N7-methylase RlmK/C1962 C5-methylase RlmI